VYVVPRCRRSGPQPAAIPFHTALHIFSVQYWAAPDDDDPWRVSTDVRGVLARHRARFEQPPAVDG
jgi:hypothetical protein